MADDPIGDLERLAKLLDDENISPEEYDRLKADIIVSTTQSVIKKESKHAPRKWVEWVLLLVGVVGFAKNFYLAGETEDGLLLLSAFDPLIWAGIVGALLWIFNPTIASRDKVEGVVLAVVVLAALAGLVVLGVLYVANT